MSDPQPRSQRDDTRQRLIEVAADLLATHGPAAVTTRSVAIAAGVQAPMIYRLFGDKDGLLSAVAEHGFTSYLARKRTAVVDDDPVAALRAGWNLHVGFGLANPALFRLMHTTMQTPDGRADLEDGVDVLRDRVRRVALAGRLRVAEPRAVQLIHAAGTGVVFALIDQPESARDDGLADLAWDAVCGAILTDADADADAGTGSADAGTGSADAGTDPARTGPASADTTVPSGTVAAAVTLHAALPDLDMLSPTERALLGDWLDRVVAQ